MRWIWPFLGLALAVPCFGAGDQAANIRRVAPQVVFSIQHEPGTGDVVQLHYSGEVYDEQAVEAAAKALAESLGSTVGWFQFLPSTEGGPSRAMFVTQNILDASSGDIRLQPLVRAFGRGKGKGQVKAFSVTILGQVPSAYSTLATYSSDTVVLKGFYNAAQPSIEYRILVLVDDPAGVEIPPRHIPSESAETTAGASNSEAPILFALVAVASVSAGALVYFSLLGKRS